MRGAERPDHGPQNIGTAACQKNGKSGPRQVTRPLRTQNVPQTAGNAFQLHEGGLPAPLETHHGLESGLELQIGIGNRDFNRVV